MKITGKVEKVKLGAKYKKRIQRWVDALRSGEYKQGQSQLKAGENFCCLGVACDLTKRSLKWNPWPRYEAWGELPACVSQYFGIENGVDDVLLVDHRYASDLNDNGATFKQIASLLEIKYLK